MGFIKQCSSLNASVGIKVCKKKYQPFCLIFLHNWGTMPGRCGRPGSLEQSVMGRVELSKGSVHLGSTSERHTQHLMPKPVKKHNQPKFPRRRCIAQKLAAEATAGRQVWPPVSPVCKQAASIKRKAATLITVLGSMVQKRN